MNHNEPSIAKAIRKLKTMSKIEYIEFERMKFIPYGSRFERKCYF